jgi:glucose/arabinose dehydrogenase
MRLTSGTETWRMLGIGLLLASCGGSGSSDGGGTQGDTSTGTGSGPSTSPTQTGPSSDDNSGPTTTPMTTADTTNTTETATGSTGTGSTTDPSSSSSDGGETGPVIPPCPYDAVDSPSGYELEVVAEDIEEPMFALGHPEEPDRLFVPERDGTIQMIEPGTTTPAVPAILEIDDVENGGESGLFGLAFHPDFPDDPRIYVNYTQLPNGNTRIAEYTLDPSNGYVGDPESGRTILEIYQPAFNHNGGGIAFDTSGNLIIGMGDGGTQSTARVTGVLLSKFLRIGVEPDGVEDNPVSCEGCPEFGPFDYTIPADNPFLGQAEYAPEIYAMGFRNPFRWSVDIGTGDLWVGDVGQGEWEEVDFVEAGRDYGWNSMEGFHCYNGGCSPDDPNQTNADGLTMPLVEASHDDGDCAIIGGAVYRSCQVPDWEGTYMFSDYCNAQVRGFRWDGTNVDYLGGLIDPNNGITGNGWNNWGDVYFTGGTVNGRVWRVVPTP